MERSGGGASGSSVRGEETVILTPIEKPAGCPTLYSPLALASAPGLAAVVGPWSDACGACKRAVHRPRERNVLDGSLLAVENSHGKPPERICRNLDHAQICKALRTVASPVHARQGRRGRHAGVESLIQKISAMRSSGLNQQVIPPKDPAAQARVRVKADVHGREFDAARSLPGSVSLA